jgi:hypothetical protein
MMHLRCSLSKQGDHILTFAKQTHNGERKQASSLITKNTFVSANVVLVNKRGRRILAILRPFPVGWQHILLNFKNCPYECVAIPAGIFCAAGNIGQDFSSNKKTPVMFSLPCRYNV